MCLELAVESPTENTRWTSADLHLPAADYTPAPRMGHACTSCTDSQTDTSTSSGKLSLKISSKWYPYSIILESGSRKVVKKIARWIQPYSGRISPPPPDWGAFGRGQQWFSIVLESIKYFQFVMILDIIVLWHAANKLAFIDKLKDLAAAPCIVIEREKTIGYQNYINTTVTAWWLLLITIPLTFKKTTNAFVWFNCSSGQVGSVKKYK